MVEVRADLASNVWKILVEEGATVDPDDTVVILESMKMEIPVPATESGVVAEVLVTEGQSVDEGDVLLRLR